MDCSNMGVVTTGNDLQAQQQNPNWFVDHKHILCSNQEGEANKLGYFILKVPECMHQPLQAFSPWGWQFGLHSRENLDSNGSEVVKLAIAMQYGLVGEKWVHFCDAIVDDPRAILACYDLQNGVTSWIDEQIKHVLTLDALFLATYIDTKFPENERRLWKRHALPSWFNANHVFYARYNSWVQIVHSDLCRVENQIPFVLIDKVVEYIYDFVASQTSQGNEPLIGDLQYQQRSVEYVVNVVADCFMITSSEAFKMDKSSPFSEKTHVLGATYKAICGSKGLLMKKAMRSIYIRIPSATKLKQSGIKLIGVDGPLCAMTYRDQCLCLPKMRIYHNTTSFIRNMAWYELNNIIGGCLFSDYIFLMSNLIQASEDLDLLIKHGVIDSARGIKGFETWTSLREGLAQIDSSQTHHDMKVAIVSRCSLRRFRLWSEFKVVFCSKPWVVLSTIVVVLVMMATLVQTYIAVISSNKMKPKFP